MLTLLRRGHVSTCPALSSQETKDCKKNCEAKRYVITGSIAVITGFIEGGIGFTKSLGLIVDGIHGFFDGSGYFIGPFVSSKAQRDEKRASKIRAHGNKVIALLIFASSLWFAYEAWGRFVSGYTAYPNTMIVVASIALVTGVLRFIIIHGSPFKNETRSGMLFHAMGDIVVSGSVVLGGISAKLFPSIEAASFDLGISLLSWLYVGFYIPYKLWSGPSHHNHDHTPSLRAQ